ncbi:MAG: hypothetical protein OQL09_04880 [Gammaproteobacteria bacterium]|nr:hypothetical protein [Gammaproteobacteria bacterium]
MKQIANTNSFRRRLWLFAMILSMLFVQSLQLHVHTYSHEAELLGHDHYDSAHSVFNINQDTHTDEVAQHDLNHSGLMSKLSTMPMLAVIVTSLLLVLCSQACVRLVRYYFKVSFTKNNSGFFQPPLRAPPLI